MTSPAKRRANRRNAQKSTGPKSAAGKARVARNAVRHGLSLPVLGDPALSPEVADIARMLAKSLTGRELDALGHALACRIAEPIVDLRRVNEARLPLLDALQADLRNAGEPLRGLVRLLRYQRRALSRRNAAVREFCAAMVAQAQLAEQSQRRKGNDVSDALPRAAMVPERGDPARGARIAELSVLAARVEDRARLGRTKPPEKDQ
jgi:hypothetical protein